MRRRAFTLIEALVATALLAVVAAACMPLLRSVAEGADFGGAHDESGVRIDRSLVVLLAERVSQKPSAFGIDATTSGELAVSWPEDIRIQSPETVEWPGARIEVLLPDATSSDADPSKVSVEERWIVLRSGGEAVARWCSVPARAATGGRRPRRVGRNRHVTHRRSRPRPGMTLIETLVAIAITSALATAVFAWTSTAARVAHAVSSRASSDATVEAVFRAISDDLLCRDTEPNARGAGRRQVIVEGDRLTVRTRSGSPGARGPVVRRYSHLPSGNARGELRVTDTRPDGAVIESVLARDVTRWSLALDEKGETLSVELALGETAPIARRFLVP